MICHWFMHDAGDQIDVARDMHQRYRPTTLRHAAFFRSLPKRSRQLRHGDEKRSNNPSSGDWTLRYWQPAESHIDVVQPSRPLTSIRQTERSLCGLYVGRRQVLQSGVDNIGVWCGEGCSLNSSLAGGGPVPRPHQRNVNFPSHLALLFHMCSHSLPIFELHYHPQWVDEAMCYRPSHVAWSVFCLSLCVEHVGEICTNSSVDQMPFWRLTGAPKESCIRYGSRFSHWEGHLTGTWSQHSLHYVLVIQYKNGKVSVTCCRRTRHEAVEPQVKGGRTDDTHLPGPVPTEAQNTAWPSPR